jgi:hypothetical protein
MISPEVSSILKMLAVTEEPMSSRSIALSVLAIRPLALRFNRFFRTFGAGWAARHDASRCTPVV